MMAQRFRLLIVAVGWCVVLLLAGMVGCASVRHDGSSGVKLKPPPATMPEYVDIAKRFNRRIARLNRIWSRANLTLKYTDDTGKKNVDRAEGYVQLIQPDKTAISVNKLGETYFYFGSNATGYWWLDLSDSSDKVALFGTHAKATPQRVALLGLPVHPLELLDLFAITPLPDQANAGTVSWDGLAGQFVVEVPALWGHRKMWLHTQTLAPQRVELIGRDGSVRATAKLERYISVPVVGDGRVPPKMASRYRIELFMPGKPSRSTKLILELYGTTNKDMSARAFDLGQLIKAYGVGRTINLDTIDPSSLLEQQQAPSSQTEALPSHAGGQHK